MIQLFIWDAAVQHAVAIGDFRHHRGFNGDFGSICCERPSTSADVESTEPGRFADGINKNSIKMSYTACSLYIDWINFDFIYCNVIYEAFVPQY